VRLQLSLKNQYWELSYLLRNRVAGCGTGYGEGWLSEFGAGAGNGAGVSAVGVGTWTVGRTGN